MAENLNEILSCGQCSKIENFNDTKLRNDQKKENSILLDTNKEDQIRNKIMSNYEPKDDNHPDLCELATS